MDRGRLRFHSSALRLISIQKIIFDKLDHNAAPTIRLVAFRNDPDLLPAYLLVVGTLQ